MALITAPEQAEAVLREARRGGHQGWAIGEIVKGSGEALVV